MSVFDDVVVNAKSAANAVGKQASKLMDLSRLRLSAADLNGEINKKFKALGRAVYDARKAGADSAETVAAASAEIDELMEQLEAVNAQLASAHAKVVCGYCGQENSQEAVFCSKCGHRLFEEKPAEPAAEEPSAEEQPAAEEEKPADR
jgi:ribosomal protein L40E